MVRITFTQGNGYKCGCCRHTHDDYVEFDSQEAAVAWLSELEARKQHPPKGDHWIYPPDDRNVIDICETKPLELWYDDKQVATLIAAWTEVEEAEKKKQEAEALARDVQMLEVLKKRVETAGAPAEEKKP
jgi:hypothetical protein